MSLRILFVEDTPCTRKIANRMLTSLGYDVTLAADAEEALTILDDQCFDLLFTDIAMPGERDGIALAHIVRERNPDMKILFASGFSTLTAEDVDTLDAQYVTKPYRKVEIATILSDLLHVHE